MGIRDAVKALSPTWLQDGTAEKFLYNFGLAADAVLEKLNQGMKLHMPGYGDPSALPLIGNDKLIPQGQNESANSYASRLKGALDAWRLSGTPAGILQQILGSVSPAKPTVRTVSDSSVWDSYIDGADTQALPPEHFHAANWDWDGTTLWWRAWVIVYSIAGSPWPAPTATYGGGAQYADGTCWGFAGGVGAAQTLRAIVKLWKPAHAWVPFILVAYSASQFNPQASFGDPGLPDGGYAHWGKVVTIGARRIYQPARMGNVSYIDGSI